MRKGKVLIALFLIVTVFLLGVSAQGQDSTDDTYKKAINAIESWIQTIPDDNYQQAEKDQKFQWKVGLEENQRGHGRFKYYEKLLDEIGKSEFKYEGYAFNKKTIRYFQFKHYGDYYSEASSEQVIKPEEFFERQYKFYKENMTSKKEQWVWLDGFFIFFNSYLYGSEEDRFINSLTKNNYPQMREILNQYLTLSKYMLENDPDVIMNGENIYSDSNIFASTRGNEERILDRLLSFTKTFKLRLEEEEKETILNFVLPAYEDSDQAVKIYKELK